MGLACIKRASLHGYHCGVHQDLAAQNKNISVVTREENMNVQVCVFSPLPNVWKHFFYDLRKGNKGTTICPPGSGKISRCFHVL